MNHIALLGESVFDKPPTSPAGRMSSARSCRRVAHATLQARDGDVTAGLAQQLRKLPAMPAIPLLSIGGDAALA